MAPFRDRTDAGHQLATSLGLALDVLVVRKLGLPGHEEVAMGAIGEGGVVVLDRATIRSSSVTSGGLARVQRAEEIELARRVRLYRGDWPETPLSGRTVLVVDDGIATGATARAACRVARARGASRVIVAVPVASTSAARAVRDDADEVVLLFVDRSPFAVGAWYDDFDQTTDEQVLACLSAARERRRVAARTDERDRDDAPGALS